jgi:4-methyl-5(b-hydroxyethyl)-thiazole monophosphate biosynthesis
VKGLIILADGFEDVEAIATIDVLKRSKLVVDLVTLNSNLEVKSSRGIIIKTEKKLSEVKETDYDFLVIPGGAAIFNVWNDNQTISLLINQFVASLKLVAAICAGPALVGKLGHYQNRQFTCFPGSEKAIMGGKYLPNKAVIRDGNFITAKAMAFSIDFGLEIVEYLQGKNQREQINHSIRGEL